MESLQGKTALITGAGKGLGRALAQALAKEGVNLVIVSRTRTELATLAEQLTTTYKAIQVKYEVVDVADLSSVSKAFSALIDDNNQIDILVNNAGIGKFAKFLDLSVEDWEMVVRTNLFGPYYCIRHILPSMIARKTGDIINVSSTAGLNGSAMTSAYSASKFGLIGMSESLMLEARKSGIRVLTLTPSTIATPLAINHGLTDGNPNKTLQPEDFAELVIAHLKLPRRALVKQVSLWSTNP